MPIGFDSQKLRENALLSIQIGIEDFSGSELNGRHLSAVRNLFAGVLLLFKYRIATKIDQGEELIFTSRVEAVPDGGGFKWQPSFKRTTIDFNEIKELFKKFDIHTDWPRVTRLQQERNEIEHLHSSSAPQVSAGFVYDLFPVLKDFIERELGESPATALGLHCWEVLHRHHDVFKGIKDFCDAGWQLLGVSSHYLFKCEECSSILVRPANNDMSKDEAWDEDYVCESCQHLGNIGAMVRIVLLEREGGWSFSQAKDGEIYPLAECPNCRNLAFSHSEGMCFWCDYELEYKECYCGAPLSLDDQENGICSYHAWSVSRDD